MTPIVSLYRYKMDNTGWKPEVREGASLIIVGKKAYLYAGIASNLKDDIN